MKFKTNDENVIEFLNGAETASVTFNSRRHITKIKKLHDSNPEAFVNFVENKNGSIFATLPLSWVKISKPRQVSEEQRQIAAERLKAMKEKANK